MSLTLILVVTAAVAASAGYLAARRKSEEVEELDESGDAKGAPPGGKSGNEKAGFKEQEDAKSKGEAKGRAERKEPKSKPQEDIFASLPLSLGDVVSAFEEERWLSGALVAREERKVLSVLFVAPEGSTLTAVAVYAAPRKDIFWMDPAELSSPDEPPATIEIDGVAFRRRGRLPVSLERMGQGVPPVGPEGIWGDYEGGKGEVAVVITSEGKTHAWVGRRLDEEQYDRLGAG